MKIGAVPPSLTVQRRDNLDLAAATRHAEDAGLDTCNGFDPPWTPSYEMSLGAVTPTAVDGRRGLPGQDSEVLRR